MIVIAYLGLMQSGLIAQVQNPRPVLLRRKVDLPATRQFEFKSTFHLDSTWSEKQALKPEQRSFETQLIRETMKPSGPGKATCKFAVQNPKTGKFGVFHDDFEVDERTAVPKSHMSPNMPRCPAKSFQLQGYRSSFGSP